MWDLRPIVPVEFQRQGINLQATGFTLPVVRTYFCLPDWEATHNN